MSRCLCHKREPCPIHKDNPLPPTVHANCMTIVIHVYEVWPVGGNKSYYSTVAKDALQVYKSSPAQFRWDAIFLAADFIKRSTPEKR